MQKIKTRKFLKQSSKVWKEICWGLFTPSVSFQSSANAFESVQNLLNLIFMLRLGVNDTNETNDYLPSVKAKVNVDAQCK